MPRSLEERHAALDDARQADADHDAALDARDRAADVPMPDPRPVRSYRIRYRGAGNVVSYDMESGRSALDARVKFCQRRRIAAGDVLDVTTSKDGSAK